MKEEKRPKSFTDLWNIFLYAFNLTKLYAVCLVIVESTPFAGQASIIRKGVPTIPRVPQSIFMSFYIEEADDQSIFWKVLLVIYSNSHSNSRSSFGFYERSYIGSIWASLKSWNLMSKSEIWHTSLRLKSYWSITFSLKLVCLDFRSCVFFVTSHIRRDAVYVHFWCHCLVLQLSCTPMQFLAYSFADWRSVREIAGISGFCNGHRRRCQILLYSLLIPLLGIGLSTLLTGTNPFWILNRFLLPFIPFFLLCYSQLESNSFLSYVIFSLNQTPWFPLPNVKVSFASVSFLLFVSKQGLHAWWVLNLPSSFVCIWTGDSSPERLDIGGSNIKVLSSSVQFWEQCVDRKERLHFVALSGS